MSVLWDSLPVDVRQVILDFSIRRSDEQEGATPLHLACNDGDLGLVLFLVKVAKVNVEEKDLRGDTPLFKAVANLELATLQSLSHAADADLYSFINQGLMASYEARFAYESNRMIQFLVEECGMAVDTPSRCGQTILHKAARDSEATSTVSWLVETGGASVTLADYFGYTALHEAAMSGNVATAEILLNHGAFIEARNEDGYTALCMSCKRGHTEFCRFLIESWDANVHAACPSGKGTLLHEIIAWPKCNVAMVKLLIDKGVDVYAVDEVKEETALHMAARLAWLEIVPALVRAGGARLVHAVGGSDKSTALHYAARRGILDIVKCLVKGGHGSSAFINAVDCNGATALDLAVASGHTDVVEFLTQVHVDAARFWSNVHFIETWLVLVVVAAVHAIVKGMTS